MSSLDHGGIVGHFRRDLTNGTLTFGGCQASDTTFYSGCTNNSLVTGPSDLEVSPDNQQVVVANESCCNWDVIALDRNTSGTASHGNLTYGG